MNDYKEMVKAYKNAGGEDVFADSDVAHLVLESDKIVGAHEVEGLSVDAKKIGDNKVDVNVTVKKGHKIEKPVHMCFGVLPKEGKQIIDMDIVIEEEGEVEIMADCIFPNAVQVEHIMDGNIHVGRNGSYIYKEKHFHGNSGGVKVVSKAKIIQDEGSYIQTLFTLLEGRVGEIDFDYESRLNDDATLEMLARISGYDDDIVKIREAAKLKGEGARGLLDSKIALRENAKADIYNEMTAEAAEAKGHVDCTEIIKDNAIARAVPIVDVRHSEAKITHEAAIGSVDTSQLETLMARGLNEEEATDVIIQGLLNG